VCSLSDSFVSLLICATVGADRETKPEEGTNCRTGLHDVPRCYRTGKYLANKSPRENEKRGAFLSGEMIYDQPVVHVSPRRGSREKSRRCNERSANKVLRGRTGND